MLKFTRIVATCLILLLWDDCTVLNLVLQYQIIIAFPDVKGMFLVSTVTSTARVDAVVIGERMHNHILCGKR